MYSERNEGWKGDKKNPTSPLIPEDDVCIDIEIMEKFHVRISRTGQILLSPLWKGKEGLETIPRVCHFGLCGTNNIIFSTREESVC